jgi:nicotinate phosphoribosyltransferase
MPRADLHDRLFWLANEKEIRNAETTDAYFLHTKKVLQKNNIDSRVVMEVFARDVPYADNWGILSGVYEVAKLLEGLPLDVWAFDEGSVFVADRNTAMYEPLLVIEGKYVDFVEYENPLLGLLSASTSVSTRAAKFRLAAGSRLLLSFGSRRVHPALAPLIERACYLAGFDGVSNVLGAKLLKLEPSGTMPHALVQILGSQEKAWRLFDETIPKGTPRVALVDTFWDEKTESIKALEVLGPKLWGVRLDTPASRRGDFAKIAEEVRWELDIRGGKKVKIIASGRLDEDSITKLNPIVDGYGVERWRCTASARRSHILRSSTLARKSLRSGRAPRGSSGQRGGVSADARLSSGRQASRTSSPLRAPPNPTARLLCSNPSSRTGSSSVASKTSKRSGRGSARTWTPSGPRPHRSSGGDAFARRTDRRRRPT